MIDNKIEQLPNEFGNLTQLIKLCLGGEQISSNALFAEQVYGNNLTSLPHSFTQLAQLIELNLDENPLNPELAAAYEQGLDAVMAYLRAKIEAQIVLNEAKLILIGEGEVGKSCLLGALRGDEWEDDRLTTHGIEI